MIRYEDVGLVTDDPVIAAMYLGENLANDDDGGLLAINSVDSENPFRIRNGDGEEHEQWLITIPYPTVLASIQPVEGEGYIADFDGHDICDNLHVLFGYSKAFDLVGSAYNRYHKRVLNIVTTRSELRELIERCGG